MKIWLVRVSGPMVANDSEPTRLVCFTASSLMGWSHFLVTEGFAARPNCTTKFGTMRKKRAPSKNFASTSLRNCSAPRGAQSGWTSTRTGPLLVLKRTLKVFSFVSGAVVGAGAGGALVSASALFFCWSLELEHAV